MQWTSAVRWLLLAIACGTNGMLTATEASTHMVLSAGDDHDSVPGIQPSQEDKPYDLGEEQTLDGDPTVATEKGMAKPHDFRTLDSFVHSSLPDEPLESPGHRVRGRQLRRNARTGARSLSMPRTPDLKEATGYNLGPGGAVQRAAENRPASGLGASLSLVQVGVSQIFDQLLTGALGTGLNLMQGGPAGAQQAAMTAAATPAVATTPAYYPAQNSGLSTMEIILIISGSVLVVGLLGLLVWLVMSKKKRRR